MRRLPNRSVGRARRAIAGDEPDYRRLFTAVLSAVRVWARNDGSGRDHPVTMGSQTAGTGESPIEMARGFLGFDRAIFHAN